MSYTFTSPIKNTENKETLNHCSEIKKKVDGMFENSKSILMVGWKFSNDADFVKHIMDKEKELTIVEVFPKNVENAPAGITVICSDIRDYKIDKNYDMLLWQHGPENVSRLDILKLIRENKHRFKYIILESPNGPVQNKTKLDNPYDEQISVWKPSDFEELGFEYIVYAGQTNDAFILAYLTNEN